MIRKSGFKQTNSALTQAYPDTADQIFDEHWQTWFTKADAYRLKALGINTIRIPVRLVFLEAPRIFVLTVCIEAWLLARRTPRRRGRILSQGWNAPPCMPAYPLPNTASHLPHLQREGLEWLNEVGMAIILDHHALPGVSSENQMFAGRWVYTPDSEKLNFISVL